MNRTFLRATNPVPMSLVVPVCVQSSPTLQACQTPPLTKETIPPAQRWDRPLPDALALTILETHEETSRLS